VVHLVQDSLMKVMKKKRYVFIKTFDKFNALLLNKSIHFFLFFLNLTDPKRFGYWIGIKTIARAMNNINE